MVTNALLGTAFNWTNGIMSGAYSVLQYIIWIGAAALIIWFILEEKNNKFRARIFERTHNGETFWISRAKEQTIDSISHWRLRKKRKLTISPSIKARYLDAKGKIWADGIITEQGEIQWIERADVSPIKIPEDILKLKNVDNKEYDKQYDNWLKTNKIQAREILSSTDRATLVYEMAKIQSREKQGLLHLLEKHGNVFIMAMLILVLILFWGSIAQPALQSQENAKEMMAESAKITQAQSDIMNRLAFLMIGKQGQLIYPMNITTGQVINNTLVKT